MAKTTKYEVTHDLRKLAVIAVCFNPVRYNSRYHLYRQFEEHMSQSGVFLFTVECLFQSAPVFGLPKQTYEVTQPNNPHHLQLLAPSILWMKENLINISVKHLPAYIEYIAWIDIDIEFDHLNWAHLAIDELQRYPIVQLFEMAHFLGPNGKSEVLRRDYSFVYSIKHNKPIDPRRYKEWYPHPGYAWAMRRTAFNAIGGLCEFSILGSGDLHFAYALLNRIKETFPKNLHEDYQRLAINWGENVAQLAQEGHNIGHVPINVWHHWHGSRDNRGYVERWGILERHQFSPSKDLEKNPQTGVIALANKRHIGKLQMSVRMISLERDIVAYFLSRKEDSKSNFVKPVKPIKPNPATVKPKPAATGSSSHFRNYRPPQSSFPSYYNRPTHIWTSDSGDSHINDHDSCWIDCTCPEHHDCPHAEDCPCCIHYAGEHDFCHETGNEEEHHGDEHDYRDETGHDEEYHRDHEYDYSDNTGHEEDHDEHGGQDFNDIEGGEYFSPDSGGFDNDYTTGENESNDYQGETTDYTGPGSFY